MDSFFHALFLGQPLWMWLTFIGLVAVLLAFDLGVLHRGQGADWLVLVDYDDEAP